MSQNELQKSGKSNVEWSILSPQIKLIPFQINISEETSFQINGDIKTLHEIQEVCEHQTDTPENSQECPKQRWWSQQSQRYRWKVEGIHQAKWIEKQQQQQQQHKTSSTEKECKVGNRYMPFSNTSQC